jgi:hypothetical protein
MLEALGYKQGTDFEWADVFTFAATKGLTALTAESAMTNDALAVGAVDALAATNMDGDVLLDKLIADGAIAEADAIAAGLKEEVVDFAIESVVAWGLRGLMITFTSEIDGDVTIDLGSDAIEEDGNVAYVTLDATKAQNAEVKVKVTATGKDGIKVDAEEVTVVMQDKVDPTVVSVVAENQKTIKVTYSEPVADATEATAVFDDIKIDGAKLVGTSTLSDSDTVVTYVLNTALAANTYVFTSESVTDYAGFVVPAAATTITVVADETAPSLVETNVLSTTTIELVFDEAVSAISGVEIGSYTVVSAPADNTTKVLVTLNAGTPLVASDAFVAVSCMYDEATDLLGNKSAEDVEFSFLAPMDDVAPTATAEVTSDNYVLVTFSETVTGLGAAAAYTLTDNDDSDADVEDSIDTDITTSADFDTDDAKKILVVPTSTDLNGGTYTLTVGKADIVDGSVLANKVAETTFTLTMNDIKKPSVSGVVTVLDTDKARLSFDEAMDVAKLTDVNNYLMNGSPLATFEDVALVAAADGKSVDITAKTLDAADQITPFGLTDVAGNVMNATGVAVDVDPASAFTLDSAELTAKDTIVVTASADVTIADANEFKIYENGIISPTRYVTSAVVDGTKITLTLNDGVDADVTTGVGAVTVVVNGATDTVDAFGTAASNAVLAPADKVAPTVTVAKGVDSIVITFDEAVDGTDAATVINDILLKNKDGNFVALTSPGNLAVTTGADFTDFTVLTISGLTTGDEYTIEILSRNIGDGTNTTPGLAATAVTPD